MIAMLNGTVHTKTDRYLIVDVGGVGYKVFATARELDRYAVGAHSIFYTHYHVREDDVALYGFATLDELEMFESLIGVSGVGPKSGLGIMEIASPRELRQAIAAKDFTMLTKVSGIGRKTAERVVLELGETFRSSPTSGAERHEMSSIEVETIEALESLGYPIMKIREVVRELDPTLVTTSDRVRAALKRLGKKT